MATTIPISLRTVSSVIHAGPATIPAGVTDAQLVLNRNVGATPMDLQLDTSTTLVTVQVEVSADGGTTWVTQVQGDIPGGKDIPTRGPNSGVEQLVCGVGVNGLIPGQQIRATITPAATFTTSGSLILTP